MGCCCSTENTERNNDEAEDDETTQLLNNPINISDSQISPYQSIGTPTPVITEQPECSSLNRILRNTTREFIDVGNMEADTVEYQEQKSRSALYRERLIESNVILPTNPYALPVGVAAPNATLFANTVSQADILMITQQAAAMAHAVHSVRATGKEQLVVSLATFL